MRCRLALLLLALALPAAASELTIDPSRAIATFDPATALGATIDGHGAGETAQIFTEANVAAMLSAGFQPLSYRLATELGGEAWHWNPRGRWSDARRRQGYWTSSDQISGDIDVSFGYRLPRRGNTISQAFNVDYSRIDDGDRATFWKSNPYLDSPQWLFVDLGAAREVASMRIVWGVPFARDFVVQHWEGVDPVNEPDHGRWVAFARGAVTNAGGGITTIRLEPAAARYVRLLMTRPSRTAPPHARDPRDRAGYAVAELSLFDAQQRELVRHARSADAQSIVWVSSTDPWHRASDVDQSMEQPGLDRVVRSGLTRGLPMLVPVALLYGTPDDAAAELRYLRKRHVAVRQVELGEEPDGQELSPEDYGALFLRWADALHAVDPRLQLGGPSFQSTYDVIAFWPDARGRTGWMERFLTLLRERRRLADFAFFSFEWYPFDDPCADARAQLARAPQVLERVLARWRAEGVPRSIPWIISEYGWSSYAAEAEVDLEGALFNAEVVAQFLSDGGSAAYFYGLEPEVLMSGDRCASYGNLALFQSDEAHRIRHRLAAFYAAQLVMHSWLQPRGTHALHAVAGTTETLRAFAVRRPDGEWSLLVINKGPSTSLTLRLGARTIDDASVEQLSPREYVWHPRGEQGSSSPDGPPARRRVQGAVELPARSLTVIRF